MNVDFSVCQALNHIEGSESGLLIYDVCCQWVLHFKERVAKGEFLSLWEHFKLTPAVGKFHLGAHIMETLWFIMDKVSGMTRSMSWAHRQEMLDDYMEDGNFKKLVRSGKFSHRLTPVNALTITQWTHW